MGNISSNKLGQVLHLKLDRPEKKNALTPAMYTDLSKALNTAKDDFDIRVVVISGAGSAFTGGNDILDFMDTPPTGPDSPVMQFLAVLHDFPKPLIAAVHGNAVGIGTTMLMHCDLVYATADAKFSMPFVSLGLFLKLDPRFSSQDLLDMQLHLKSF